MSLAFPKPHFIRSKRYLAWIRGQPCIICRKPSEPAHIGTGGTGIKTDDYRCIALCHYHHNGGNESIHHLGRNDFEARFAIDLAEQIIRHLIRFMSECLEIEDKEKE